MVDQIELIDESDRPVGQANAKEVHQKQLLHHSVHIIIINSEGRFFCARRSLKKEIYGGWWTVPGAHVLFGETYDAAANRLCRSVFGIDCKLEAVGKIRVKDGNENEISTMYIGHSNQKFKVKPNQFDEGRFLTPKEAKQLAHNQKVTPYLLHSIALCKRVMARNS